MKQWVVNMPSLNLVSIGVLTHYQICLSSPVLSDRVIQKKRRDYLDPNSSANMKKLNDDLQSIHNIMRKTIDDVLDRGNKLDGEKAAQEIDSCAHMCNVFTNYACSLHMVVHL